MAKLAFIIPYFLTNKNVESIIHDVFERNRSSGIELLRSIQCPPEEAGVYAQELVTEGAEIIISRGLCVNIIKESVSAPVINLNLTGEDIAVFIKKAIDISGKPNPNIYFITLEGIIPFIPSYESIFEITLNYLSYPAVNKAENEEKQQQLTLEAIKNGADVLIGGAATVFEAAKYNIPALYYSVSESAVTAAIQKAKYVAYSINQQKKDTAQLNALIESTFQVILRLDENGKILSANDLANQILGHKQRYLIGRSILNITNDITIEDLDNVLAEGKDIYSKHVEINGHYFIASLTSIKVGDAIIGAYFTCQESIPKTQTTASAYSSSSDPFGPRFILKKKWKNKEYNSILERAQKYASSESPILINAEFGCSALLYAKGIHSLSPHHSGQFICINCNGENLDNEIFTRASGGTLCLLNPQYLNPEDQCQLLSELEKENYYFSEAAQNDNRIRLITVAEHSTDHVCSDDMPDGFLPSLWYYLSSLKLDIPPLRKHPEDAAVYAEDCINEYCKKYKRHLSINHGAYRWFPGKRWGGNFTQLKSFCEFIVLTTTNRNIDEIFLEKAYGEKYGSEALNRGITADIDSEDDRTALHISKVLEECGGRKNAAAIRLGISTTTLWRWMKKYKISSNYLAR